MSERRGIVGISIVDADQMRGEGTGWDEMRLGGCDCGFAFSFISSSFFFLSLKEKEAGKEG